MPSDVWAQPQAFVDPKTGEMAPYEESLQAAAPPRRRPRSAGVGAQLFVLDQVLLEQLVRQASQMTRPVVTAGLADDWKIELGDRFHQLVRPVQAAAARVATRMGFDSPWLAVAQQDALEAASEEFIEGVGQWVGSTSTTIESAFPVGLARSALALAGGFRSSTEQPEPVGGVATGSNMLQALRESGLQLATWVWRYDSPDRPFPGHEDLDGVEFASWNDPALEIQPADAWLEGTHYRPGDHDGCRCGREPLFSDAMLGSDDDEPDALGADGFDEDAHPRDERGKFGPKGDAGPEGPANTGGSAPYTSLEASFSSPVLVQAIADGSAFEQQWDTGDGGLRAIQEAQGFNGPPLGTPVDSILEQGGTELFRGDKKEEWADQLISGDLRGGVGFYGNGTYSTPDSSMAERYAAGGTITRMGLHPDARVVEYDKLVEMHKEADGRLQSQQLGVMRERRKAETDHEEARHDETLRELIKQQSFIKDHGRFAAALGYDAISVHGGNEMVVLNRTRVAIEKRARG